MAQILALTPDSPAHGTGTSRTQAGIARVRIIKSQRDKLLENNAADKFYARMYGKEPAFQNDITRKRAAPVRDPSRVSEANVNAAIRSFSGSRDDLGLWRNNKGMVQIPGAGRMPYRRPPNG